MGGKSGGSGGEKAVAKVQQKLGEKEIKIGQDYLDFSKKQYADNQGFVKQVLDIQMPAMRDQLKASQQDRARYLKYFAPMEAGFAQQAAGYDTPARREAEAAKATADVATTAEAQRQQAAQSLESYGIDPSMTRAQAIDRQVGVATAANEAQAANQARTQVEQTGINLKQAAINVGRGYPAQVQGAQQGLTQSGAAATNEQLAPGGQMNQSAGVSGSYFGNAANALSGAANTYANVNAMANQTPWLDAVTTIAGGAAGAYAAYAHAGGGLATDPNPTPANIPIEPDTIPTMLGKHEFVIPADVLVRKGTEFFQKLIGKTRDGVGIPEGGPDKKLTAHDLVGIPKSPRDSHPATADEFYRPDTPAQQLARAPSPYGSRPGVSPNF